MYVKLKCLQKNQVIANKRGGGGRAPPVPPSESTSGKEMLLKFEYIKHNQIFGKEEVKYLPIKPKRILNCSETLYAVTDK